MLSAFHNSYAQQRGKHTVYLIYLKAPAIRIGVQHILDFQRAWADCVLTSYLIDTPRVRTFAS